MAEIAVQSLVSLDDKFIVGQACSGAGVAQNMYGMYVRIAQDLKTDDSNLVIASQAHNYLWKPLIATSLGHSPADDWTLTTESLFNVPSSNFIRMTRDYRDSLVHTWKVFAPELTWDQFRASPMGFSMVREFEDDISEISFSHTFSYEEMVKEPQVFLTKLVELLLPRQDNPELGSYGQAKREISLDQIDLVVQESQVRDLRERAVEKGLLDAVGVYKHFLNREQIEEIDEFVASL